MKKKNKIEAYIESFLMTSMIGITLIHSSEELEKIRSINFNIKEDNIITLDSSSTGTNIEKVSEEETDDIKKLIIEEVDSKIAELDEKETEEILEEQYEEVADNIVEEMNNEEKKYSGMALSHEYEDYLKHLCSEYAKNNDSVNEDLLYRVVMTIGYRESAGNWNNSGVVSSTYDVGVFQINKCNFKDAQEKFGFTENDLRYNDEANAIYAVSFIGDIMSRENCNSIEDTYRTYGKYNGGNNWINKKQAVNYAKGCMEIQNEYFPEYENSVIR